MSGRVCIVSRVWSVYGVEVGTYLCQAEEGELVLVLDDGPALECRATASRNDGMIVLTTGGTVGLVTYVPWSRSGWEELPRSNALS